MSNFLSLKTNNNVLNFQALSEDISLDFRKLIVRISFIMCGVLTFIELCCYISFFLYIYNHDNNIAAQIVSQATLYSRNRSTAISMVGQIASWLMEVWYTVLVGIFTPMIKIDLLREVSVLVRISQYFYIPLMQILTSDPIKNYIKREGRYSMKLRLE